MQCCYLCLLKTFSGVNFLSAVVYFSPPKKSNPEIYQDALSKFLKSKNGKQFISKYGKQKFLSDKSLFCKHGGLFGIVKSWVRLRANRLKVARTVKWCKARVSAAEKQHVEALVHGKQHNRLESMVEREHCVLAHPFIQRHNEVVVSETRPFGFIINLNMLEKPESFELTLKVFLSSDCFARPSMDKAFKKRNRMFT